MEAIDERSIREQLAAIVVFVQAGRLRCFLHFIVEETLQGRGGRLKKFVVAIEALDKTDSFKPRTDATVRVQAGRLRSKLRQNYADAPRGAVVIELPNGSYTPLFSNVHPSSSPTAATHQPAPPATQTRIALAVLKVEHDRLRVVAWTTDRQFQQGNRDFLTVVEGSVRKKDNYLRIAAYFIRVADRSYPWSEIYDRELQDIFVIQDEISSAIVDTLKVQLAIGQAHKSAARRDICAGAPTLAELTREIGVNAEALEASIAAYNRSARSEAPDPLGRCCFGPSLAKVPFSALGPAKSWRVTTGRGVRINQNMQGLDSQRRVVPRLHAAGSDGIGGCLGS